MSDNKKYTIDPWGLSKTVIALFLVGFLWMNGKELIDSWMRPPVVLTKTIKVIDHNAIKIEAMKASDAEAKVLRKEFEEEKSKILAEYEKDKKRTKEVLDELGIVKSKLKQTVANSEAATKVYQKKISDLELALNGTPKAEPPKNASDYEFKKVYATAADGEKFPIAWAMYFPNRPDEQRWKTGTYPVEYHTKILETENKDGSFNRYAEVNVKNEQMSETAGKSYPVKITDIKWAKMEKADKNFMWNTRIGLGVVGTTEEVAPNLNLSLASYGRTKVDLDWRFLTFGAGGYKEGSKWEGVASFEPVSWNMGTKLPLIDNLFIGPVVTYNTNQEVGYGIQLSIPF